MSSNLPGDRKQALEWVEARIGNWNTDPTAIGLTTSAVTDLLGKTIMARSSFVSVESARQDSKNSTQTFYTDADTMHQAASPMVANIKNFADNSSNPDAVYFAAEVSPVSPKTPAPPPATPVITGATINGDGSVTIGFDATGSVGTVWQVARQLSTETSFSFVGNADVKTKSFIDSTLPAGPASATYQVTGIRGSLSGLPSFGFEVKFGGVVPVAAEGSQAA